MVQRLTELPTPALYEADETAWLELTAELVRAGRLGEIDAVSLAEYLADMAIRDNREVKSRLKVLLMHLLKWEHRPDRRGTSWRVTIRDQRYDLLDILDSRSLRNHPEDAALTADLPG